MELTSENVKKVFVECLFSENDIPKGGQPPKKLWAIGGGVMYSVVFDKRKIKKNKETIKSLLSQLPESFRDPMGDSFTKMPFTKDDKQWGEQINADQLLSLGRAANYIFYTPKPMWIMSFGVPMVVLDLEEKNNFYQKMIEIDEKVKKVKEK